MAAPRKSVLSAMALTLEERDRLFAEEWFLEAIRKIDRLRANPPGEADERAAEVWRNVLDGIQADYPFVWEQYGPWGLLQFLGAALGHEVEPEKVRRLYPDVDAMPYEVTRENIERMREEIRPGQLWLRVKGPRVGRLEGYLEWRLREMREAGADVTIKDPGRPGLSDGDCLEAARLHDEERLSYWRIGERFGWPLQNDAYLKPRKCRTAEEAVKRGRALPHT